MNSNKKQKQIPFIHTFFCSYWIFFPLLFDFIQHCPPLSFTTSHTPTHTLLQMIGNSINHPDNKLVLELNDLALQDDDTASIKSYGSHKNRMFQDESHKGSAETLDGEEKRDASKEERMDMEGGGELNKFET